MENVKETNTIDCVPVADLEKQLRSLSSEDRANLIRFLRKLAAEDE